RYSYRLCIRGDDESLISFSTAENVMAKLPANLDGFSAVQSTSVNGAIEITLNFPGGAETASYDSVEIRRAAGTSAPSAACNDGGDHVTSFDAFTDTSYTDSGLTPPALYSYRVCIFGIDGSLVSSTVATSVKAKPDKHIVFVTSSQYKGNLGGVDGADAICTSVANGAGLTGTYKAILSTMTVDARDRIAVGATVYNTLNQIVADDGADFWDTTLD